MSERLVGSKDVAGRLGVHESRVRSLLQSGRIPGQKIGNRWVLPQAVAHRIASQPRPNGRPLDLRNSWGLLFLASGEDAPWLSPPIKARLRRRLARFPLDVQLPKLRRRAEAHYYQVPASTHSRIAADPVLARSGVSAGADYPMDIRAPHVLEAYVPKSRLADLEFRLALAESDEPGANLILRGVPEFWPLEGRKVAPKAAVAADLIESRDERTRRAGQSLLAELTPTA
jgi:hypothetical protein